MLRVFIHFLSQLSCALAIATSRRCRVARCCASWCSCLMGNHGQLRYIFIQPGYWTYRDVVKITVAWKTLESFNRGYFKMSMFKFQDVISRLSSSKQTWLAGFQPLIAEDFCFLHLRFLRGGTKWDWLKHSGHWGPIFMWYGIVQTG